MHKIVPFPFLFIIPLAASAQKDYTPLAEPLNLSFATNKAPLFQALKDTAKAASYHAAQSETAIIIGQATPHWLVVKRGGFPYYVNTSHIQDLDGLTALELGEAMSTPLPLDASTKLYTLTGVVEVPGATKAELYSKAYEWVAKAYRSANDVIQMQDKESGKIIAKGITRTYGKGGGDLGYVRHTLSIYVKDGKYKYELTNFEHTAPAGSSSAMSGGPLESEKPVASFLTGGQWKRIKTDTAGRLRTIVRGLQRAMVAKDNNDF